jgi:hypothetical protein
MNQPIRAYLPATLPILARLRERGELAAGGAYAVTPALRAALGGDDGEELSYAAFRLAADASVRLLGADPTAPRRRVVISVDVAVPGDGDGDGVVRLAGTVPLSAVAAVHVDGAAAEPEVVAAVAAVVTDPAAGEAGVDHELEWYDVSELPQLLA